MPVQPPNYTQLPNAVFDHWMRELSHVELKVLLFLARETFGWHRQETKPVSLSALMEATGTKNRNSVVAAVARLSELELIRVVPEGRSRRFFLNVIVPEDTDEAGGQYPEDTDEAGGQYPEDTDAVSVGNRSASVLKKEVKERTAKERTTVPSTRGRRPKPPPEDHPEFGEAFAAVCDVLVIDPKLLSAAAQANVRRVVSKAIRLPTPWRGEGARVDAAYIREAGAAWYPSMMRRLRKQRSEVSPPSARQFTDFLSSIVARDTQQAAARDAAVERETQPPAPPRLNGTTDADALIWKAVLVRAGLTRLEGHALGVSRDSAGALVVELTEPALEVFESLKDRTGPSGVGLADNLVAAASDLAVVLSARGRHVRLDALSSAVVT